MSTSNAQPMFHTRRSNIEAFYVGSSLLTFNGDKVIHVTLSDNKYRKCQTLNTNIATPTYITDWLYVRHATAYLTAPNQNVDEGNQLIESYNLMDSECVAALLYRLIDIALPLVDNVDLFLKEVPICMDTNPLSSGMMFTITGFHFNFPKASFYIIGNDVVFCKVENNQKYNLLNNKSEYQIELSDNLYLLNDTKLRSDKNWRLVDTTTTISSALNDQNNIMSVLYTDQNNIISVLYKAVKPKIERMELSSDFLSVK